MLFVLEASSWAAKHILENTILFQLEHPLLLLLGQYSLAGPSGVPAEIYLNIDMDNMVLQGAHEIIVGIRGKSWIDIIVSCQPMAENHVIIIWHDVIHIIVVIGKMLEKKLRQMSRGNKINPHPTQSKLHPWPWE